MTTRTVICFDEDAETLIADDDILVVSQRGHIEVWSANGETHMGNLPLHTGERVIRKSAEFWLNGFTVGVCFGRDEAQAKLRAALGLGA